MTIRRLLALADGLQPMPVEKVDVRVHCAECDVSDHEPLVRHLTRVVRTTIKGEPWLYWYWTPEPIGAANGFDCGFSGRRLLEGS